MQGAPLFVAFLSHTQQDNGDRVMGVALELKSHGFNCWVDRDQLVLTAATMKTGIAMSSTFVLFASPAYLKSWFCRIELQEALRLGKHIVVVQDLVENDAENSSSSKRLIVRQPSAIDIAKEEKTKKFSDIDEEFLRPLFSEIVNDIKNSNDPTREFLDWATFQSNFEDRVDFNLFRGHPKRIELLDAVLRSEGEHAFKYDPSTKAASRTEIFIIGHPETGADQAELLALALGNRGIRVSCLYKKEDPEKAFQASWNVFTTLIVYLTKGALKEASVDKAVTLAKGKKIVCVFEADFRRTGAQLSETGSWDIGALRKETLAEENKFKWLEKLLDDDCVAFSQFARRGEIFDAQINMIAERCGFADVVHLNPSFDAFEAAISKADKLEMGTREWLIQGLVKTAQEKKCSFFLAGPGMGKSTVVGSIAKRGSSFIAQRLGGLKDASFGLDIAAVHCFVYSSAEKRSVEICLKSIARQLCRSLPGFRVQLLGDGKVHLDAKLASVCGSHQPSVGQIKDMLDILILDPCRRLTGEAVPNTRVTILIDALDECETPERLSRTLKESWDKAPEWLGLLGSSRPNASVKMNLKQFGPYCFSLTESADDVNRKENDKDIRTFVENRMCRSWRFQNDDENRLKEVTQEVLTRSEGVFLWLEYQEEALAEEAKKGPLTKEAIKGLPMGLEGVYLNFFNRVYQAFGENAEQYNAVFSIGLIIPREPIPEGVWEEAIRMGHGLGKVKDCATSLLIFEDGHIRAPHKSMVDFLNKVDRAPTHTFEFNLAVKPTASNHFALASALEDVFNRITIKDYQCTSEESEVTEMSEILNVERRFSCAHAAHHWTQARDGVRASQWFTDFRHVFRSVCEAVQSGTFQRLLDDGNALLQTDEKCIRLGDRSRSLVKYWLDILRMSRRALKHDPRELAGQCLGRVGIEPFDFDQQQVIRGAEEWLKCAREVGGLDVAVPAMFGWSGLQPAGGALMQIIPHSVDLIGMIAGPDGRVYAWGWRNVFVYDATGTLLRELQVGQDDDIILAVYAYADNVKVFVGIEPKTWSYADEIYLLRVWDLETKKLYGTLELGSDYSFELSSDGKVVCLASSDREITFTNIETRTPLKISDENFGTILGIAHSADGHVLLTIEDGPVIIACELEKGGVVRELNGLTSALSAIAFSVDGKIVCFGFRDGTIRMWELETGKVQNTVAQAATEVSLITVSPDGTRVCSGTKNNVIQIWQVGDGALLRTFEGNADIQLCAILLSRDCQRVWTCSNDKTIRIWDVVAELGKPNSVKEESSRTQVEAVAVSPKSTKVCTISGDNRARIWDTHTGKLLLELSNPQSNRLVIFSGDGKSVFLGASVWDSASGKELGRLRRDVHFRRIAVSWDGKMAAALVASDDSRVAVWNVRLGTVRYSEFDSQSEKSAVAIGISPDGTRIFVGGTTSHGFACVWTADSQGSKKLISNMGCFRGPIFAFITTDDGTKFCSLGQSVQDECIVNIWEEADPNGRKCWIGKDFYTSLRSAAGTVFSSEGTRLLTCDVRGKYTMWDIATKTEVHGNEVSAVLSTLFEHGYATLIALRNGYSVLAQSSVGVGFTPDVSSSGLLRRGSAVFSFEGSPFQLWMLTNTASPDTGPLNPEPDAIGVTHNTGQVGHVDKNDTGHAAGDVRHKSRFEWLVAKMKSVILCRW